MANYNPLTLPAVSAFLQVFQSLAAYVFPPKHSPVVQDLLARRKGYKRELLRRNERIRQLILRTSGIHEKDNPSRHPDQSIDVLCDLTSHPELESIVVSVLSTCPPEFIAELREWQQDAHFIACIDSALDYFPHAHASKTQDPIWDAMLAAILAFPPPPPPPQVPDINTTPTPQPDDRELVLQRRVFFDEPEMQSLIHSLDEKSRLAMQAAADKERSRLPMFPAHLRLWNPQKAVVEKN